MRSQKNRSWLVLDGEKLGEMELKGGDMFWLYGVFNPMPNFEKYRALFDRLESLWEEDHSDEVIGLLEETNKLNLCVENEQGQLQLQKIREFKISKGWFEYRII